jgi:dienelactone hydrolase
LRGSFDQDNGDSGAAVQGRHGLAKPDRQALIALSAHAEIEVYPGTHHGFAFPKRPVYNRAAAERHWERLLAPYRRNLQA